MSIYALPALIALLIKVGIIVIAAKGNHNSKIFIGLLAIMATHNLSEFLLISTMFDGSLYYLLLRCYYITAIFSLAYICLFAFESSGWLNRNSISVGLLTAALVVSAIIGTTDYIIAGAKPLSYTVTAVTGPWYSVFLISTLLTLGFAVIALFKGLRTERSAEQQHKAALMLLALSPIILTATTVIVAMNLGASFTGAMLFPIATSLFLYIALRTERGHHVVDIRRFLPYSAENITVRRVSAIVKEHLKDGDEFKEVKDRIELILVEHALNAEEHNVTWAAKRLGVKRSSFYSLLNKYGVSPQRSSTE